MVKKGSKKAAEDREFEEAISEFANEKEALKTTSSQGLFYSLVVCVVINERITLDLMSFFSHFVSFDWLWSGIYSICAVCISTF